MCLFPNRIACFSTERKVTSPWNQILSTSLQTFGVSLHHRLPTTCFRTLTLIFPWFIFSTSLSCSSEMNKGGNDDTWKERFLDTWCRKQRGYNCGWDERCPKENMVTLSKNVFFRVLFSSFPEPFLVFKVAKFQCIDINKWDAYTLKPYTFFNCQV